MNQEAMAIYDPARTKITKSSFSFPEFVPVHFWDKVNFRALWPDWPHPFFYHANPKNVQSPFNFCDHVSTCKKSVYSICSFFRYSQSWSPATRLTTPISDHAHPKNFQTLFNLCETVHAKNEAVSSIYSRIMVDLKTLQSEWQVHFGLYLRKKIFHK